MPGLLGILSDQRSAKEEFELAQQKLIRKEWITTQHNLLPTGIYGTIGVPTQMQRSPTAVIDKSSSAIFGYLSNTLDIADRYEISPTISDSEFSLRLFLKLGVDAFKILDGCFNLAIFDGVEENFYLVNDCFGHLPLYYYHDPIGGRFAFSPELKGFLSCPWISREISWEAFGDYFVLGQPWGGKTFLKNVIGLDPGSYCVFSKNNFAQKRYWSLSYDSPPREDIRCQVISDQLHQILKTSMSGLVHLGGRRGIFISGGFDSRMIACYMKDAIGASFDGLGMQYGDHQALDSIISTRIAKSLGIPWKAIVYDISDAPALLEEHLATHDGTWPCSYLPNTLPNNDIRQAYDFIINGNNGNHLFGDYATRFMIEQRTLLDQGVHYDFFAQVLGDGIYRSLTFRIMSATMGYMTPVLNNDFANTAVTNAVNSFDKEYFARPDLIGSDKYEFLALTQTGRRWGVFNIPLMDHYEQINPFYDRRELIEFMASLPFALKYSRLYDAENMRRHFPEVNAHPKISGYPSILRYNENVIPPGRPLDDYYNARHLFSTVLAKTLDEKINDREFLSRSWINPAETLRLWNDHKLGKGDNSAPLSTLIAADYFYRNFIG